MSVISFIGLGNMGGPMAANLVRHGHTVRGFDLSAQCCAAAASSGVTIVADAADAVEGAACIITMLPVGNQVLSVYAALVPLAGAGALFIDCSTIDVGSARHAHEFSGAAGMLSLDAPVSGGTGGASAGTLTFMAGGTDAAFAKAEPILACMGRKIVHCGEAGAGQAAKICNNMILGISMIAVSEAFVLGEKLGLSHQALFDVASTSSGQCWSLTTYCPVPGPVPASPANNAYKPGFAVALMLKDLRLAQQAAKASGVHTALGAQAAEIYGALEAAGDGGADFSAIIRAIRHQSGSDAV
jgi:3-hydroxyisobutyrate dehydrogenase